MYNKPQFKPHFHVEVVEPETVYLLSEQGHLALRGRLYVQLAPLLDGRHTVDEIVQQLKAEVSILAIYHALVHLESKGYLTEADYTLSHSEAAFWSGLDIDPRVAVHKLQNTKVSVMTCGAVESDSFISALEALNLQVDQAGDFTVVLTDDYLQVNLDEFNKKALENQKPWLLVKPVGSVVWLGPLFIPNQTGCWECLADRLRGNREVETAVQHQQKITTPFPTSRGILPSSFAIGINWAAMEIAKAIATDPYGYLTKPFKRAELHTTITTALHRCQLEKQLQATQQWLTSTLNSIGDGTITTDEEGRITFMNPVAEALTGWLLTEVMGKPVNQVLELYNPQTGQAIENSVLLAMQEGIPFELPKQCQLRTKEGKERLIDDMATPIRDAFGQIQGGVIVFRDITETQRMQAALQESEARFQTLAANLPGVIYRVLHRLNGSVECLYLSPCFQTMFEMELESFQQGRDSILAAIHPDDASSLHTAFETMLQTLQPYTWEGRIQVPSGQIKWIQIINRSSRQANGDIICDGLIVDISERQAALRERKRTEQALQRQIQRERLLSEIAQQIYKSFDLHEILTTVVTKVRQMLQVDRVLIFQINPDGSGVVIQESVDSVPPTLGLSFCDKCFPSDCYDFYWQGQSRVIPDTSENESSNCLRELMQKLGVKSKVVMPIIQHQGTATTSLKSPARKLWGLLIVHACDDNRQWQSGEVDLLRQISNHLAIAIQQSELYQKLQQANEHLECLVKIDALTQVANRRRFDEYIQQQWNQLAREQKPLSLILCDIDFFKRYNDTYGHPAGDACLVQIAQAINHSVKRPADLVTRYGGEEFAIILPNTDHKGAVHVAITIQNQVRQLQLNHIGSNVADYVTVSMGIVTTVPSDNSLPQALIAATDLALYQAKQQGRDRYCIKTL